MKNEQRENFEIVLNIKIKANAHEKDCAQDGNNI
jgi:hypothetical protein